MTRTRVAVLLAALIVLPIAACSSDDGGEPEEGATSPASDVLPDAPTGADRDGYLDALGAIDQTLVADEGEAIDNGINQCSGLGGADPTGSAQMRFSTSDFDVSPEQAEQINEAVRTYICPDA